MIPHFVQSRLNVILSITAEYFNITVEQIKGNDRFQSVVDARKIALKVSYQLLGDDMVYVTLQDWGYYLKKTHGTIIFHKRTADDLYQTNRAFQEAYDMIVQQSKKALSISGYYPVSASAIEVFARAPQF